MGDNVKNDRKCTYNVTLRRVLATISEVEKQYFLHILSVCVCVCVCVCGAALVTQHTVRMYHVFIFDQPNSTIFLHIIS